MVQKKHNHNQKPNVQNDDNSCDFAISCHAVIHAAEDHLFK